MEVLTSAFFIFLYSVIALFTIYCYFRIIVKAGYAWEYGLLSIIPVLDIIWFFIFAFDKWPIQETLDKNLNSPRQETGKRRVVSTASTELKYAINFCPSCGQKLSQGVKYCSNCGSKVGETT